MAACGAVGRGFESLWTRVNLVPLFRPTPMERVSKRLATTITSKEERGPMAKFMYGLKSSEARRQYPRRLKMFFDFIDLEGTINEQARQFIFQTKNNPSLTEERFMEFVEFQIERSRRGEIAESTISNYYKAAKLFCEMNDVSSVNWKKIRRGIPRGRQASNDRAPTIEEIQKLVEYPDRRIKPIVYTMMSLGIRLGAWDYLQWEHVKPLINEKGEVIAAKLTVYAGDQQCSCISCPYSYFTDIW
jgi:hypothetical protein